MLQTNIHIISHSDTGEKKANELISLGLNAKMHRSPKDFEQIWQCANSIIFIGALGICVRTIAPYLVHKTSDPAVVNIESKGRFVQPVVSGHVGGANQLALKISRILGAQPVITTVSDSAKFWALDMLAKQFNWKTENNNDLTAIIAKFVNKKATALLLEARDKGTLYLETTLPKHVKLFYNYEDFNANEFEIIIAVTPYIYSFCKPSLFFRPAMLCLGLGCQRDINAKAFSKALHNDLIARSISPLSIAEIGSIDLKANEAAFIEYAKYINVSLKCFSCHELSAYTTPNPSKKVADVTGSLSVSEAVAMHLSKNQLFIDKTKGKVNEKYFTFAVALKHNMQRKGFVEIVGAGPGDPELISVKGKRFLQTADLILYAGSLVPKELTYYAKPGCVIKSSAGMDLATQIETMKAFYKRGLFTVRLHTGDPCIYGAIQEQMAKMDELRMDYHITPGISSFQAAAAALQSQFTIPEQVQSIILTRGEGRTPMPEKEQLHLLAQSQSTMCIYLSASIAEKVQRELLLHYPTDTPVAICYKLTWSDEKIWRTTLNNLAKTIADNNLSMTTMIVVGKAIGNRIGESKLYHKQFTHAFREGKE